MNNKPQECDCCANEPFTHSYDMWLCKECFEKESVTRGIKSAAVVEKVNTSVQVRTDIFNKVIESIESLKLAIESDESVENKTYELASKLTDRINHYKKVIFALNEKLVETSNGQRATQEYLNNLANKLRSEEREKLRLQDISYKPKTVSLPKVIKKSQPKFNKVELRVAAKELGVSEFMLQMLVVQKGWTVSEASDYIRKSLESAKGEQNDSASNTAN